jgi:RNA recognition motif-containing protein
MTDTLSEEHDANSNINEDDSFKSTVNQSILEYNYLVLLSVQRQQQGTMDQSFSDSVNMAWMTLDSSSGATIDSTEVHIYNDYALQQALQKFDNYAYSKFITQKKTFCLVVLDAKKTLRDTILALANDKGIQLAAHYRRFFDLKSVLLLSKDERQNENRLNEILNKLDKIGNDQEGLILGMGEVIKSEVIPRSKMTSGIATKTSKPLSAASKPWHYKPITPSPSTSTSTPLTPLLQQEIHQPNYTTRVTPKPNISHRPHRDHNQPLTVVRLRGLPWTATEQDIIQFFTTPLSQLPIPSSPNEGRKEESAVATPSTETSSPRSIEGLPAPKTVLILLNLHNRSTGEAYVEFPSSTNEEEKVTPAQRALNDWQGRHMGHRYIEIFPASPGELQYAQHMMKMNSMLIPQTLNVQMGPPPMILPVPPQVIAIDVERSSVVRIRSMPFNTTVQDVVKFFEPLLVNFSEETHKPGDNIDIVFINSVDGRPTGDAYIKFASASDATEAVGRSRQKIGNRHVEIFKVPEQEMIHYSLSALGAMLPPPMGPPFFLPQDTPFMMGPFHYAPQRVTRRAPRSNGTSSQHHDHQHLNFSDHVVRVRGLPFTCDESDIADFFNGLNIAPQGIHLILNESNDRSTGEALVEFNSDIDVENALKRHRQMIGKRYIEVFRSNNTNRDNLPFQDGLEDEQETEEDESKIQKQVLKQQGVNGFNKSKRPPRQNSGRVYYNGKLITSLPSQVGMDGVMLLPMGTIPPTHIAMPVHHHHKHHRQFFEYGDNTVRMRGLPFTSTSEDIIQFFDGYELDTSSIQIRVDSNGRKNGEAYVNFASMDEAKRAVEERNRCHMGSRYIELFLVNAKGDRTGEGHFMQGEHPSEVHADKIEK